MTFLLRKRAHIQVDDSPERRSLPSDLPGALRVDEKRLRQILLNLLSNAVKFTPEGGAVNVRGRARRGMVTIAIADNGIGIPREALHKLGNIMTGRSRCTILPYIALSQCVSKSTSAQEFFSFARGPCGYLAIQTPRSQMLGRLLLMHMI